MFYFVFNCFSCSFFDNFKFLVVIESNFAAGFLLFYNIAEARLPCIVSASVFSGSTMENASAAVSSEVIDVIQCKCCKVAAYPHPYPSTKIFLA